MAGLIEQQKMLISKLEKGRGTMKPEEKTKIMKLLKELTSFLHVLETIMILKKCLWEKMDYSIQLKKVVFILIIQQSLLKFPENYMQLQKTKVLIF